MIASMSSTWIPYEHRQRADQRVTKKSASKPCEIASDTLDSKQEQHIDKANSIASRGPTSEGYDENLAEGSERDAYRTQAKHSQRNQVIVVGCTMIDMHVSTRMDEHFKVSPYFEHTLWPFGVLLSHAECMWELDVNPIARDWVLA